jgi:hypothetical protein
MAVRLSALRAGRPSPPGRRLIQILNTEKALFPVQLYLEMEEFNKIVYDV